MTRNARESRWRLGLGLGFSIVLLVAALTLPTAWYDALPRLAGGRPLPMRGTTLLQVVLVLEAVVVALVTIFGAPWVPRAGSARADLPSFAHDSESMSRSQAMWCLSAITALAVALRIYGINDDLWVDELTTLARYAREPYALIIGSYRTPNNHLLISLLMKASITLFGEQEWSIRLAAVVLGIVSIPAIYRVARLALSRQASLGAAMLLAVSYHHVFFSQNARGYIAYVCFALIGTRALVDALREDRRVHWILYGAATVLGFMSLLHNLFVVAAQLVVIGMVLMQHRRRGHAIRPLLIRLAVVLSITGIASLQVYAIALPEAYVMITTDYTKPSTGYSATSRDLSTEVLGRLADGFASGHWAAALPFLVLAAIGMFVLWQRHWSATLLLTLPGVLTAALLLGRGFTFSPRYFLLWLPLAVLAVAALIEAAVSRLRLRTVAGRRAAVLSSALAVAVVSALSLPRYYAVPKQPYRNALRHVERTRRPDDLVFVIHPGRLGVQFYGERLRVPLARDYRFIRTVAGLDSALATRGTRGITVITTLERGATIERPELLARVNAGWRRDTTFEATIGDGQLHVWSEQLPRTIAPR